MCHSCALFTVIKAVKLVYLRTSSDLFQWNIKGLCTSQVQTDTLSMLVEFDIFIAFHSETTDEGVIARLHLYAILKSDLVGRLFLSSFHNLLICF